MRAISVSTCVLTVLVTICFNALAQDEGKDAIRKKLEAEYQLTKTNYDKTDIVTAGSIVVLQKDKVLMLAASSSANPCKNTYKDGVITQNKPCAANEKLKKVPSFLRNRVPGSSSVPDSPASHTFVTGEKFWVTSIVVKDDPKDRGIYFDFFTDEIGDAKTRFSTSLVIPFGAFTPTPDQALKLVHEVITVAPAEDAKDSDKKDSDKKGKPQPASQGGEQAAATPPNQPAAAPAAAAPEAPPPPIEAPPPPPADPTNIAEGQTIDEVVKAMGQPLHIANVGTKVIYSYKDLKVTFVNGKVKDIQ
jgi:hypothetical protein